MDNEKINDERFEHFNNKIKIFFEKVFNPLNGKKEFNDNGLFKKINAQCGKFKQQKSLKVWWDLQPLINECVVVFEILKRCHNIQKIEYELDPDRIDFHIFINQEKVWLVEVKSINPHFQDKIKKRFIPPHITLVADDLSYNQDFSARSKIIDYVLDFEKKIKRFKKASITKTTILVFCTNNYSLEKDGLEDFVTFYKTDNYSEWDGFSKMQDHYLRKEKICFEKSVNCFALFQEDACVTGKYFIDWNVGVAPEI